MSIYCRRTSDFAIDFKKIVNIIYNPQIKYNNLQNCRFVNDALHIFLENLAEFNKSFNIIGWSFPIQRTHREIVVFSAMYSKLLFEIIE